MKGLPAGVTIREMAPGDLDAVTAIEIASFPTPWSRALFAEEIVRVHSDALVAVPAGGGPVQGYAVCWTVAGESHLLNIAVHPAARGRGIGRALLRECMRRGAAAGATRIHLEVRPSNREAIALYLSEGFRRAGIRRGYYTDTGEDALLMVREFTAE